MAQKNIETGGEQRSLNHSGRDRPSNPRQVPVPSLQQPPDFFTDSLNTSYIPSPSPVKENTRPGVRARPRRILGTPRSLAASFKAISHSNNDNRPPSSASSSDYNYSRSKSNTYHAQENVPAKYSRKPIGSSARSGTPSPTRGRQISVVSPSSSASSPPRGLAEAYQRINDEELLAQEDSIGEDMGNHIHDNTIPKSSEEADHLRIQRQDDPASPSSWKTSRRASSGGLLEDSSLAEDQMNDKMDKKGDSDGDTVMSNLDNLTDNSSTGGSSQYTRDLQRVNLLNSDSQAFKKARLGRKVGLTVENLKRRNGSSEPLGKPLGGSISSRGSDPSVNVPHEWGRKARPGKEWLSRINSKSGRFTGDFSKGQKNAEATSEGHSRVEPLDEWITATAEPLSSGEDGSTKQSSTLPDSTPTMSAQNMSLERVTDWEINDDDFTGRSLQASDSPPIRVRNGTVDHGLGREIDSLAKRAVTTNRLGELRDKTSSEGLRKKFHSRSSEDLLSQVDEKTRETPRSLRSSLKFPLKPIVEGESHANISKAGLADRGDPIPDSPIVVFRSNADVSKMDNLLEMEKDQDEQLLHRPNHDRHDSRDILRKLARATSESPTSSKGEHSKENLHDAPTIPELQTSKDPPSSTKQNKGLEPAIDEASTTGKSGSDDATVRKPVQHTPEPSRSHTNVKTPLVTGAWIDTPLPTGGSKLPLPTPADLEDEKDITIDHDKATRKVATTELIRKLNPNILTTRPKPQQPQEPSEPSAAVVLPKSALESILTAAKSPSKRRRQSSTTIDSSSEEEEEPTLHLSESTIQSLEEILHETPQSASFPSPAASPTLTSSQPSSIIDNQFYARQLSHLRTIGPSIRDAKRRLATLERTLSTSRPFSSTSNPSAPTSKSAVAGAGQGEEEEESCIEAGEFHDFIWPCERCGCTANTRRDLMHTQLSSTENITMIAIPIPRLWRWRNGDRRPQLTWLGVAAVVWAVWWVADFIAW